MFFTQEDYKKIQKWLLLNSVKDTEFGNASLPLTGSETITLVQNGENVKVPLKDLVDQIFLLGVSDLVNVTVDYNSPAISLSEAIELVPARSRKIGQIITFLNEENKWEIKQFMGTIQQWNITSLWVNLFEDAIINSLLPDEVDITKTPPDSNGNSFLKFKDRSYNPAESSGLGMVILRTNLVSMTDPNTGITRTINYLYQDIINKPYTIYEIRYDYNLNGGTVIIPEGCVLNFVGGSITNGNITFTGTYLDGNIKLGGNLTIQGDIRNDKFNVLWFGTPVGNTIDASPYIQEALNSIPEGSILFFPSYDYKVDNTINITKGVTLEGTSIGNYTTSRILCIGLPNGASAFSVRANGVTFLRMHIRGKGKIYGQTGIDIGDGITVIDPTSISNTSVSYFGTGINMKTRNWWIRDNTDLSTCNIGLMLTGLNETNGNRNGYMSDSYLHSCDIGIKSTVRWFSCGFFNLGFNSCTQIGLDMVGYYLNISNNSFFNSAGDGIRVSSVSMPTPSGVNVISGNVLVGGGSSENIGIHYIGHGSVISNNATRVWGGSGIKIEGNYNNVVSNTSNDNGYQFPSNAGIDINGLINIVTGNSSRRSLTGASDFGISVAGNNNIIQSNSVDSGTASFTGIKVVSGTHIIKDNIGFKTSNKGLSFIAGNAVTTVVSHGCNITPAATSIYIMPVNKTASTFLTVSDITATTFTVTSDILPGGAGQRFNWHVIDD